MIGQHVADSRREQPVGIPTELPKSEIRYPIPIRELHHRVFPFRVVLKLLTLLSLARVLVDPGRGQSLTVIHHVTRHPGPFGPARVGY